LSRKWNFRREIEICFVEINSARMGLLENNAQLVHLVYFAEFAGDWRMGFRLAPGEN
jgi:hypothetical protein